MLLDFGIAHVTDGSAELTRTGHILGTPGYMAPEQVSGRDVDARADVFALGCVLFRVLAGRTPFTGRIPGDRDEILLEDTPRLGSLAPNIPRGADDVVARMLRAPKRRGPRTASRPGSRCFARGTRAAACRSSSRRERRHPWATGATGDVARPRARPFRAFARDDRAMKDVLDETVSRNRAVMDVLTDGSILITATSGEPHDVASRAARCALGSARSSPTSAP